MKKGDTNNTKLEDILEMYGISNPLILDPYCGIQRVHDDYMMGTKKVTFDATSNIYIDGEKYKGTLGLWKLIMMKKPPKWEDRKDLTNYELILKQTDAVTKPRNVIPGSRPYQTYKCKNIFTSIVFLVVWWTIN